MAGGAKCNEHLRYWRRRDGSRCLAHVASPARPQARFYDRICRTPKQRGRLSRTPQGAWTLAAYRDGFNCGIALGGALRSVQSPVFTARSVATHLSRRPATQAADLAPDWRPLEKLILLSCRGWR